jgi:hypothetical protein
MTKWMSLVAVVLGVSRVLYADVPVVAIECSAFQNQVIRERRAYERFDEVVLGPIRDRLDSWVSEQRYRESRRSSLHELIKSDQETIQWNKEAIETLIDKRVAAQTKSIQDEIDLRFKKFQIDNRCLTQPPTPAEGKRKQDCDWAAVRIIELEKAITKLQGEVPAEKAMLRAKNAELAERIQRSRNELAQIKSRIPLDADLADFIRADRELLARNERLKEEKRNDVVFAERSLDLCSQYSQLNQAYPAAINTASTIRKFGCTAALPSPLSPGEARGQNDIKDALCSVLPAN